MEYLSWDVIQRECQPKFGPEIPQFIQNNESIPFLQKNAYLYSAPFIVFYKKIDHYSEQPALLENLTTQMGIPHQCELLQFYEDYLHSRFSSNQKRRPVLPPKDIKMLGHKLFVVQYQNGLLNAIDGLSQDSINLLALPIQTMPGSSIQFIIKIYDN